MKYKITWKFLNEPERADEYAYFNPLAFIGHLALEQARLPYGDWLKYPLLEYYHVERIDETK